MNDLDARLLAAHASGDHSALVALYTEAAERTDQPQAAGFYLTHAYVFALELGTPDAANLRETLISLGRETPL